jgi:hypothetical protein
MHDAVNTGNLISQVMYFVLIVQSVDFWLVLTIHAEFAYYKQFMLGRRYFRVCVLHLILFFLVLYLSPAHTGAIS